MKKIYDELKFYFSFLFDLYIVKEKEDVDDEN